ncbi:Protein CBR-DRR-2 [Caenorhabditis briggsae]|uniref:RRM domain-containing protein n=3 Tax=Caenorhabditis TaxID=6237 RepID=A0AAE9INU9_CAEBR|nr:Protein CBR-DRR-2 [Caenorhabditis briggsae]PIC42744.1 hypothetical protein B9Z55_009721 [Caenorhabditis nigoni]ULU00149.1 hypothetical protein L3Y34_000987 [Caenorhabditis briggsae]UMM22832.1 hypothetical protein L5515_003841 [Caenorhabditis briggsae]CAP35727.1 Protein CBR-DRR-2 [Caenorhabditis briggsae]
MADEIFKAFVGGLPFDALESDIETLLAFCEFTPEEIKTFEIHLVHDRETGQCKGFGYVTFSTEQQLNTAISSLNGADFEKRKLKVNRAQQRDRNDRGGRGGGRGGFGGDRGGRGGRGGGGGGFHRGGGGRFNDGEGRGGFGGGFGRGNRGGHRQRKESDGFGGSQHEDGHHPRQHRQSEDDSGPSAPPAERPRFNFKPRTTDAAEIEARKKQEEEETKRRQEKLFQ